MTQRRTTVLVGVALAVVLVLVAAVAAHLTTAPPDPIAEPPPPPSSRATSSAPKDPPQRGKAYPVRTLGSLRGRSVVVSGYGNAELRYARVPHNGTRLHFTCDGCDADTWLVQPPSVVGVGTAVPLEHPADVTAVLDVTRPRTTSDLLVKAPRGAEWIVTLTPFAEIPVHRATFDALDDDVVAVSTTADVLVTCGGPISYRTLAREQGEDEYADVQHGSDDAGGTTTLEPGRSTDLLIVEVRCRGRWTVAVG